VAKTHPDDLATEVQNAIIDLKGCQQDEINSHLERLREDLAARLTEDQLKYHVAILQKIRVPIPNDVQDEIRRSQEFSKEIKKKCNLMASSNKIALNIPNEKKLKLRELEQLNEEQMNFKYITPEMITLTNLLDRAH